MIPLPSVNRETASAQGGAANGVAERRVGDAGVCAEFDQHTRPNRINNPMGKWYVAPPGANRPAPFGEPEKRRRWRVGPRRDSPYPGRVRVFIRGADPHPRLSERFL